ncbi:NB-ARC domains-containing protein [Tanacetum coccineum]
MAKAPVTTMVGILKNEAEKLKIMRGRKDDISHEVNARVNHLFVVVAFTAVSQTVKAKKIHKDLEVARKRIVKGEKVLVILDDVWEKLDLDELSLDADADLKRIAVKVVEECSGLPLFLNVVGNALKTKSIEEWDKALSRLQEHSPVQDEEIDLEYLVYLAVGLEKFRGLKSMEDAR